MNWQKISFIIIGSASSVALFLYTFYTIIFSSKIQTDKRMSNIKQMTADMGAEQHYAETESLSLGKRIIQAAGSLSQRLKIGQKSRAKKQLKLLRSGILMKPEELTGITILLTLLFVIIFYLASRSLFYGIVGLLLGYLIPNLVIQFKMSRRAKKLNSQLPDALSVIANGIRAGFSFNQAVSLVVKDMEAPISEEFGKLLRENSMGKPMDEALEALSARTGDEDLDIVITALLIQRQVGGSLADVLETIAETIRERVKLKGDIRTMTAQGKLSATIVSIMPLIMGVMMSAVSPGYMDPLFNTGLGRIMLGACVFMISLGIIVLAKIVKIKV